MPFRKNPPSKFHILHTKKGFTLIELLVVISIIAILGSIGYVFYDQAQTISRDGKRIGDLREIQKALELYYAVNNSYPGSGPSAVGNFSSINSPTYFPSGAAPLDPKDNVIYNYYPCTTAHKYVLCANGMESTKNKSSAIPTDGCSGFVSGSATYCVGSLSN